MPALRLLGWVHVVLGAGGLLAGATVCAGLALEARGGPALQTVGPAFLLVAAVWLVPGLAGGIGLLRGRRWGRTLVTGLSLLWLPLVPAGTLIGGGGLWVLYGSRRTPAQPATPSPLPGVVVAAGAALLLLAAMIGTGWLLRDVLPVLPPPALAGPVGLLTIAGVTALALRATRTPAIGPMRRRALRRARRAGDAARRARLARLAADPLRRAYADRVARGEAWSDAQIDYHLDTGRTATCPHLAPLERAMRAAHVDVRLRAGMHVEARCRIAEHALTLPPEVVYVEDFVAGGRAYEDPRAAALTCRRCDAAIHTVHPAEAVADVPSFPHAPA